MYFHVLYGDDRYGSAGRNNGLQRDFFFPKSENRIRAPCLKIQTKTNI